MTLDDLRIKIFADGADLLSMCTLYAQPYIRGFTTNPTLMHTAGIQDYRAFAQRAIAAIPNLPISFEVFADTRANMESQARKITTWGEHVYVKIPVTNTKRRPMYDLIRHLSGNGVKVNVTAVMTQAQIEHSVHVLKGGAPAYVSVFAGRIADTGRDPIPYVKYAVDLTVQHAPNQIEIIWASPREVLNVVQAAEIGCHIITATPDILKKLPLLGKNLAEYSLDTVRMFHDDAQRAGFALA